MRAAQRVIPAPSHADDLFSTSVPTVIKAHGLKLSSSGDVFASMRPKGA